MIYLDTSVVVAALTSEAKTERVQRWLSEQPEHSLFTSEWTLTEFSSAMSRKLRTREIDEALRAEALMLFYQMCDEALSIVQVSSAAFRNAARLTDHHATPLRAADALHLAVCAARGAVLCSLDDGLLKACRRHGVQAINCAA